VEIKVVNKDSHITKTMHHHNSSWETQVKWLVHNKCSCSLSKTWEVKANSLITKEEVLEEQAHNNTDKNNKSVPVSNKCQ